MNTVAAIGLGIIGYGFMGKTHAYGAKTIPLHYDNLPFMPRLAAVCGRTRAAVLEMRERCGFDAAFTDYRELLAADGVDAVAVSTPNTEHREQVLAALRAGKHVYCDKPLALTSAEARELADARKNSGLVAQIACQFRFCPAVLRAKELIGEGRIGAITGFRGAFLHSGSIDKNKPIGWKLNKAAGGGVLFDLGSHILDLLYWLLGPFDEIFASTRVLYPVRPNISGGMVPIKAEDQAVMMLRLPCGAEGTVEVSKIHAGTNDDLCFEIYGDRGAIRFNAMFPNTLEFFDNTKGEAALGGERGYVHIDTMSSYPKPGGVFPPSKFPLGWLRAHIHCLYSFLSCVHSGNPASPSFEDGAYITAVLERAYDSAREGRWMRIT
jgi:predicted dehydrogenase